MHKGEKGPTVYDMGLSSADIQRKLGQIKRIAQWAMQNHYDGIYVA